MWSSFCGHHIFCLLHYYQFHDCDQHVHCHYFGKFQSSTSRGRNWNSWRRFGNVLHQMGQVNTLLFALLCFAFILFYFILFNFILFIYLFFIYLFILFIFYLFIYSIYLFFILFFLFYSIKSVLSISRLGVKHSQIFFDYIPISSSWCAWLKFAKIWISKMNFYMKLLGTDCRNEL